MTDPTPEQIEAVKLLPCPNPWCTSQGSALPAALTLKRSGWRIICGCGVSTFRHPTEAEAVAAWNTRSESTDGWEGAVEDLLEAAVRLAALSSTNQREEERERCLAAVEGVRAVNAANFKLRGLDWESYDQAVRDCHAAIRLPSPPVGDEVQKEQGDA